MVQIQTLSLENKSVTLGSTTDTSQLQNAWLFTINSVIDVLVPATRPYDGKDDGILNLDNKTLFTHDLLQRYWTTFFGSATSVTAFW